MKATPGNNGRTSDESSRFFLGAAVVSFLAWILHSYAPANLVISVGRLAGKFIHH